MDHFPRAGGIGLLMPQQTAGEQIQGIKLYGFWGARLVRVSCF
jgi:hypothetical protein